MSAGRRSGYEAVDDIETVADEANFEQGTELTTSENPQGGVDDLEIDSEETAPREQLTLPEEIKPKNWRERHPLIWNTCFWSAVIALYGLLGGILFNLCEFHHEKQQIINKKDWFQQMNATLYSKQNETIGDNMGFLKEFSDGLINLDGVPDKFSDNRWNLEASAFFAFTTASTIGYGYTAPVTKAGKAMVFFYGLPGIAIYAVESGLCMAFFALGKVILDASNIVIQYLVDHLDKIEEKIARGVLETETECDDHLYAICCFWFPRKIDSSHSKGVLLDEPKTRKSESRVLCCYCVKLRLITVTNIQRTLIGVAVMITLVLAGAASLHRSQGWGYGNSIYYMFVSISTIGYGDFQPDSSVGEAPAFPLAMIFLGLCVLAAIISQWQDGVQSELADILDRSDTVFGKLSTHLRKVSNATPIANVVKIRHGGALEEFMKHDENDDDDEDEDDDES